MFERNLPLSDRVDARMAVGVPRAWDVLNVDTVSPPRGRRGRAGGGLYIRVLTISHPRSCVMTQQR